VYVNVKASAEGLQAMLKASKGKRDVPVIVEADGAVKIGYGGA
jgi:hypothetical protein